MKLGGGFVPNADEQARMDAVLLQYAGVLTSVPGRTTRLNCL